MYLHNVSTTVNGFEDSNVPWVTLENKNTRMDGSRYYEFEKKFGDRITHKILINDWRDTPHGGFWINVCHVRNGEKADMAFECSEWVEVCIIINAIV